MNLLYFTGLAAVFCANSISLLKLAIVVNFFSNHPCGVGQTARCFDSHRQRSGEFSGPSIEQTAHKCQNNMTTQMRSREA